MHVYRHVVVILDAEARKGMSRLTIASFASVSVKLTVGSRHSSEIVTTVDPAVADPS